MNLILLLNNYVYKEDNDNLKFTKIFLDYSTKDSEDKEKEKIFIRLKRKRCEENSEEYKNNE